MDLVRVHLPSLTAPRDGKDIKAMRKRGSGVIAWADGV